MTKDELINKITKANHAYIKGYPFLTDEQYDILWNDLYKIDPHNSILYHTTNDPSLPWDIFPHAYQIMGTQKAFSMEDLKPFLMRYNNTELILEPKYDGCACVVYKQDNYTYKYILEGDGIKGRDISHHEPMLIWEGNEAKSVESIELIIPWKRWDKNFGKNPRNTVAGWIARKEMPDYVDIVPHTDGPLSYTLPIKYTVPQLEDILLSCYEKWSSIYPLDGIMIKVLDKKTRIKVGDNGTSYNWSIAWKPPIQTKETHITDIQWNVSRSGRVIPKIKYDPVSLCGTVNTYATANNAQWVLDKGIQLGAKIIIGKAGEIIPKIVKVLTPASYVSIPTKCPICQSELNMIGVDLICDDDKCIAKLIKSISYFYSDKGMDLKSIGESMIEKLILNADLRKILITSPWALLDPYHFEITQVIINIIGSKRYLTYMDKLTEINNSKSMVHFMAALGYKGLAFRSALKLVQYINGAPLKSSIASKAIANFTKAMLKYEIAVPELPAFTFIDPPKPSKAIICITGTLSCGRKEKSDYLMTYNYHVVNSVSKATDYLIAGENPGKTKLTKANELNIPIIDEEHLDEILKGDLN